MPENTEGTRTVRLCRMDALYTGSGHPLSAIKYNYDREGYIKSTVKEFYYCEVSVPPLMGLAMRKTERDAYGIIVSEVFVGEDGREYRVPRTMVYEKDEKGLVRRATSSIDRNEEEIGVVFYISGYGKHLHRRALKTQVCYLDPDGSFSHEYRYKYDKYGWKTHIYHRTNPTVPFQLYEKREIDYDEYGNPSLYHGYVIKNTYDEYGSLREAEVWEGTGKTGEWVKAYRHEYIYQEFILGQPDLGEKT